MVFVSSYTYGFCLKKVDFNAREKENPAIIVYCSKTKIKSQSSIQTHYPDITISHSAIAYNQQQEGLWDYGTIEGEGGEDGKDSNI